MERLLRGTRYELSHGDGGARPHLQRASIRVFANQRHHLYHECVLALRSVGRSWRFRDNNHHRRHHDDWRNNTNPSRRLRFTRRIGRNERIAVRHCFRKRSANRQRIGNCFCYPERNRVIESSAWCNSRGVSTRRKGKARCNSGFTAS